MNGIKKIYAFILFAFFLANISAAKEKLKVYLFHRPPFYIAKPHGYSGILVEKAKEIFKKAGIDYSFITMPPARILNTLEKEKNACSIGWLKTKEREKKFIFSKPIYIEDNFFVFAVRKDFNKDIKSLLDSPKNTILLVRGFSYGENIDKLLRQSKIRKFWTVSCARNLLLMVKNRRGDCTIISKDEADFWLKDPIFKDSIKLIPFKQKKKIKRYLIFSKYTDKKIIEKINKAIEDLK